MKWRRKVVSSRRNMTRTYLNNGFSHMRLHFNLVRSFCLVLGINAGLIAGGVANAADDSELSTYRLFGTKEFDAQPVPRMLWSEHSSTYFVVEDAEEKQEQTIQRLNPATGETTLVASVAELTPKGSKNPLKIEDLVISDDESKLLIYTNSKKVWRRKTRGDYWLLELASKTLTKLGGDAKPATMMFAKFSPDGSRVGYVRENNIYVQDLENLKITAVTTTGNDTLINGTADWVNEEELSLRDCFRWSPDGEQILFWQFDTTGVSKFHMIDNTVSNTPRIQTWAYPKVGSKNSASRLGVVSAKGGEIRWLPIPGDPRQHYFPHAEWTPDGKQILVQQFNRLQNELKVWLLEPLQGKPQVILTETDKAWLDNVNSVRWINNGKDFLWLSERTGWLHAYIGHVDGTELTPVTKGEYDVVDVAGINEHDQLLYFSASPENATQRYLYRAKLDGSEIERISSAQQPGWHSYAMTKDAKWALHTYSTFSKPPVTNVVRMSDHSTVKTIVENNELRKKLSQLKQPQFEFVKLNIAKGVELDAWCIKPPEIAAGTKLPLLIYVYGEPVGSTVKDMWGGARSLWHWMLAQQGFVVVSIDNRGTRAPRGREWRKFVHRQIGIAAPKDQAAALKVLLRRFDFIDPARVGIWGWSGGGSMSLNAMFRYPDLYRTAVAIAPVADQRLYDTIYQERYMGLSKDNVRGFRDGSPITHAHKLRGNLLLIHGTGDDNCHYQGTERLMNELVASGKYFSVLPYPNRSHSVKEGENTVQHFWATIARYFHENLKSPHAPEPETPHEIRQIRGWKLHISRALLARQPLQTEDAVTLLDKQLEEIIRVVPKAAVAELKKVPLYFMPQYPGVGARAEYHPGANWLRANGRDPNMAKAVEFTNISTFQQEMNRMPNFVLHELAHAYHNRVLPGGFGNEEITKAYVRAKESGTYDKVERHFGNGRPNKFEKAYAMTTPMEYFAETTEAFFSRNDFYPFDRKELEKHDPAMFKLLQQLWK